MWGQAIQDKPVAFATAKRYMDLSRNEIPKQFEYQVLKKQGTGNFKPVGVIKYNGDLKELKSRAVQYNDAFSDLDKLGDNDIARIREYAIKHKIVDSLFNGEFTCHASSYRHGFL